MKKKELPKNIADAIVRGAVIPAVPLVLNRERKFDEHRQQALVRYYIDAGAGGIAIGVHTTQFEIRDPKYNLFKPVLSAVSRMIDAYAAKQGRSVIKVGGICGRTEQARREAEFLVENGFHAGLLSMSAFAKDPVDEMIVHAEAVASVLPLFGFYLQPSVGGRILPYEFWRRFAEIDNIVGIKIAPFNRYQTFDVVRAVCDAGREREVTLYTGNDDNILPDLLTEYKIKTGDTERRVRIAGGLLGQWSVWTKKAVELHALARKISLAGEPVPQTLLTLAQELTDANGVIFDAAHSYAGCIPGIHEILRRQGLLQGTWCLNPGEVLSPGQDREIDRIYRSYPHLSDDDFVRVRLSDWLS
jgi:dihydrodipicolinate synthase/N-acetylneuraminate lyase